LQEHIAYSLFGIFGIQLPILYGKKKQNALGQLLQEIVAQSGDITALGWVGKSNCCLPADISTSYEAPPFKLPSLSEDKLRTSVSLLRDAGAVELAWRLHQTLDYLNAPRFEHRRLHLPSIVFHVTDIRRHVQDQETYFTYEVKADGLRDLLITTKDKLIQLSPARPTRQSFLLVCPWNRCLLAELPEFSEPPNFADVTESVEDYWSVPGFPLHELPGESPGEIEPVDSESHSRALRLDSLLAHFASAAARQRIQEDRVRSQYHCTSQRGFCSQHDGYQDTRDKYYSRRHFEQRSE